MAINHSRNWQFRINEVIGTAAAAETNDDLLLIGLVDSMLGRGSWVDKNNNSSVSSGNWTVTSSRDWNGSSGGVGNNDGVNRWDTAGVLDPTKIFHAAAGSNHSWIVLQQPAIAPKFEVCIDLSNSTTTSATIVVSFGAGFGAANGGADGTATARPTATDQQILISNTSWGGGGTAGSIWFAQKTTDGYAFRFSVFRSETCVMFYNFEVPDPVVSGWTSPSISHALGSSSAVEQVTYSRFNGGANVYSKTPGGTIFPSFLIHDGSQSDTNVPQGQGMPNEIDNTSTFREIAIHSTTANARGTNGKIVDMFWANEVIGVATGSYNGQVVPAGGPIQWMRHGCLWLPHPAGVNPRTSL